MSMTSSPAPSTSFYSPPDAHGPYPPSTPPSSTRIPSPWTPRTPATPWTPRTPGTPLEDRVIEEIRLTVHNKGVRTDAVFRYGVKQSNKVICLTDDCKMKHSKANKIRNEGITLATLKSHARKDHHIELNIKEKKAIRSSPLSCQYCFKSYARPQTLKNHIKKHHSNQTLGPTFSPFDNTEKIINLPIDDQVTQALNAEIAIDPELQLMIQEYPIDII